MLHHLQAMKIILLKLFRICMFKDPNLAENLTRCQNSFFLRTPQSSWSSFFSKSAPNLQNIINPKPLELGTSTPPVCHVSHVMCHMSCVTCNMSGVRCHMSVVTFHL